MKRKHGIILLGVGLAILLCCCLLISGSVGLLLISDRSVQSLRDYGADLTPADEPEPALELERQLPSDAERATLETLPGMELPVRDLKELAHRLQGVPEALVNLAVEPAPPYQLGDSLEFWVHDARSNAYFTSTAALAFATDHAYWWVEDGYELDQNDLRQSALRFENETYPTNRHFFGSEWRPGIDRDLHVYIFLGNVPGVGGSYSGPDEHSEHVSAFSNQHEMFYINLENASPGNGYFDGILAHEFQHMIHWAVDRNEDTWVNEGLSELAALLNGYDVGGTDYLFSLAPDTQLNAWPDLDDSGPHYGASFLFLAYFLDRFGDEAIRQLVAEQSNGIAGFEAVLADADPDACCFSELFADWVVANYLDNPSLVGGRYGYSELEIEEPRLADRYSAFPISHTASVHQFATDYVQLEHRGDVTVEFTGSLKIPLVGAQPISQEFMWWSNRGDDADTRLTHAYDLRNLSSATLSAWMWYDLEVDFDYAYVQVSTDGGHSWELLANDHTTTSNPTGSSYGPALNGKSGGVVDAMWVQQSFDLTPFAGHLILLRFEVVYDDSVNRSGLCIDDISIPELGYADDVEAGDSGWLAEGWVRVTGKVPQEYVVQVITIGAEPTVQRIRLDEQNHGALTVPGPRRRPGRTVLAISAVTPFTTERAPYGYRITTP